MKLLLFFFALCISANAIAGSSINSTDLASTINTSNPALQSNSNGAFSTTTVNTSLTGAGNAVSQGGNGQGGSASGGNVSFHNPHQAPAMFMNVPAPTALCQGTFAAGISAILAGAFFGKSFDIDWCKKLQIVNTLQELRKVEAAFEVICTVEFAEDTIDCIRLKRLRKEIDKADAEETANESK